MVCLIQNYEILKKITLPFQAPLLTPAIPGLDSKTKIWLNNVVGLDKNFPKWYDMTR